MGVIDVWWGDAAKAYLSVGPYMAQNQCARFFTNPVTHWLRIRIDGITTEAAWEWFRAHGKALIEYRDVFLKSQLTLDKSTSPT